MGNKSSTRINLADISHEEALEHLKTELNKKRTGYDGDRLNGLKHGKGIEMY
jgi:hypothetical protein